MIVNVGKGGTQYDYDLEYDDSQHQYRVNGTKVPSVNQILDHVFDRVYHGDPWYGERGTAVAKAVELDLIDMLDESTIDENTAPFLAAWRKFVKEKNYRVKYCEYPLASSTKIAFAGRLDQCGIVSNDPWLFDIKCVKRLKHFETKAQLHGYKKLLQANGIDENYQIAGLQLMEDGNYHWQPYRYNPDLWNSIMTVYQEKNDPS